MVGLGAVVGLARPSEGPLWHQDSFAATAPFETFVFGREISRGHQPGNRGGRTLEGSQAG